MLTYKIINIDGGLGRVICSEPAVTTYCINNPDTRVITSFPDVFVNNENIKYLYNINRSGLFDDVIKDGIYTHPEPYHDVGYYTQKHHLIQSFNYLINGRADIAIPKIYLSSQEITSAKILIDSLRKREGKRVIAFHPFGSAAKVENNTTIDNSFRSLDLNVVNSIVEALKNKFIFLNCSHIPANTNDIVSLNLSTREYIATISQCDGYISIDSATHHIANSFNIPGVTIFGSTFPANLAYGDKFYIKNGYPKSYPTNRIPGSIEMNSAAMTMDEKEFNMLMAKIISNLG